MSVTYRAKWSRAPLTIIILYIIQSGPEFSTTRFFFFLIFSRLPARRIMIIINIIIIIPLFSVTLLKITHARPFFCNYYYYYLYVDIVCDLPIQIYSTWRIHHYNNNTCNLRGQQHSIKQQTSLLYSGNRGDGEDNNIMLYAHLLWKKKFLDFFLKTLKIIHFFFFHFFSLAPGRPESCGRQGRDHSEPYLTFTRVL